MKFAAQMTPIRIELVGGISDGLVMVLDKPQKTITVGEQKYTQAFTVNRKGLEVYRCASGDGRLKETFFDKEL
jgi:hypothetical protein